MLMMLMKGHPHLPSRNEPSGLSESGPKDGHVVLDGVMVVYGNHFSRAFPHARDAILCTSNAAFDATSSFSLPKVVLTGCKANEWRMLLRLKRAQGYVRVLK